MATDMIRGQIEPVLEAMAERVGWMPVVFVPALPAAVDLIGWGCTPHDLETAQGVIAEGQGLDEAALVGVDRWVRTFAVSDPETCYGHVVVLSRVSDSLAPALVRLVRVLVNSLTREHDSDRERERLHELENSRVEIGARLEVLEADRSFHDEFHEEMTAGNWSGEMEQTGSLHHIVSCLARHLGSPVVLQGRNLLTLAEAGPEADSIGLAPGRHQSARDVVGPLTRAKGIQELPPTGGLPRRLVAPVRGGGELLGFITTIPAKEDETTARRALECAVGFVALERLIRAELEEAQQLDREALLRDLFTGASLHRLLHRGLRMDIDLRKPYFPCAFATVPANPTAAAQLRPLVLDAVRESMPSSSESLGAVLEDVVVALVPEDALDGVGAVCDRVIAAARELSMQVRAGVGPLCCDLGDYETAVRKARWVTEVLDGIGGQNWAAFDDLGIYAILFDRDRATQLDEFVERQLGALISYDDLHKTDLVETLRCVLDTGAVMTEAAKQLYIHISTLKYRVNRIEELLGVELRDAQAAFNLHLACKILGVRRHLSRIEGVEAQLPVSETADITVSRRRGAVLAPVEEGPSLLSEARQRPAGGARR